MTCPVETIGGVIELGHRCASPVWEVIGWAAALTLLVWLVSHLTEETPDDTQARLDELEQMHRERVAKLDRARAQIDQEIKRRRELRAWPQDDKRGE